LKLANKFTNLNFFQIEEISIKQPSFIEDGLDFVKKFDLTLKISLLLQNFPAKKSCCIK